MPPSDYNKIISTINSVSSNYTYVPDPDNLICIDSSNNRIGINTLDPLYSIDVSNGTIRGTDFMGTDFMFTNNTTTLKTLLNRLINKINDICGNNIIPVLN